MVWDVHFFSFVCNIPRIIISWHVSRCWACNIPRIIMCPACFPLPTTPPMLTTSPVSSCGMFPAPHNARRRGEASCSNLEPPRDVDDVGKDELSPAISFVGCVLSDWESGDLIVAVAKVVRMWNLCLITLPAPHTPPPHQLPFSVRCLYFFPVRRRVRLMVLPHSRGPHLRRSLLVCR